jgi:hypothetical protein
MCMKINELSSYPRPNIGVEAGARDRSGFVPSTAPTIQRRARRAQPGPVLRRVGDSQQPKRRGRGRKVAGGDRAPQKMLKMKVDPEMYMKTKDHATICPTQKTTFLPGCTPFYTKSHVFCRNRRGICHYLSAGKRTGRFKM